MLVDIVTGSGCGPDEGAPRRPCSSARRPSRASTCSTTTFEGALEKSRSSRVTIAAVAEERACAFLDAGTVISSSDVDGIHLDEPEHAQAGTRQLAEHVRPLLG